MKTGCFIADLMRALIPAVVTSCVAPLVARPGKTLVVANAYARVEGSIGNNYPFNIGANTMHYLQVYAASEFGAMPAAGAFITGIAFRRDAGWPAFSATLRAMQINLSTTAKAPDGLASTFASNVGADDTIVFVGSLSLSSTATGRPAGFDILIPLATPFFYDPAAGNLLLDVLNRDGGTSSPLDAVLASGDSVSRQYNPITFTTGSTDSAGLVTKFVFSSASQPPAIINQPQNQSISCGTNVTLRVGATGVSKLFYQWRRNGNVLPEFIPPPCSSQTLTLSNVDVTVAGIYDVVVSNNYGSVTRAPAALTVVDNARYGLRITRQGSAAVLSWPVTCGSYVLQESSNLNASANWPLVPSPPLSIGANNYVTLSVGTEARFYRLVSSDSLLDVRPSAFWTDNGPGLAGRLSAIVASPAAPNTLLVSSPGGGVWRTTDGGATWAKPVNYALGDFSVVHLEWDRIRSSRLYASTYSDLYASTDLGDHWSNLTHFGGYPAPSMPLDHTSDPKPFAQLRYSPSQSTVFWSKPCLGLSYSYDGSTFTQHWPFPGGLANPDNCILAIAADDATGYVYFSTMVRDAFGPAHLFRSACPWTATTPCLTWVNANTGLANNSLVADIVAGGSSNVLAAALDGPGATLVYTTTTGTTWIPVAAQPPNPAWDPRRLASPAPNQLLLGTVLAYQTTDWGAHWNQVWYAGMHPDVRSFYWASYPSGSYLWMTTDGSASSGTYAAISRWNFTPGGVPSGGTTVRVNGHRTWQAYFMMATASPPSARRRFFMGSLDNGCLCSDNGTTWTTSGTPPGLCGDYPSLVFAPSNPNRAYARTCDGGSFARSDNAYAAATCAAVTWSSVTPAAPNYLPRLWTEGMIAVDPLNADHVCFANDHEVAVSADAGNSWTPHSLPDNAPPVCVYFNSNGDLYAGSLDHGAYKSTNNGVSWTPFGLNSPAPNAVLRIAHSSVGGGEGTFFLATTSGLYRKLPGGAFIRRTVDPSYIVSDVEIDPTNPSRVCIAMGYAGQLGQHRGGVLLSLAN